MAPLFSLVTPVYAPPLDVLEDTVRSVLEQDFDDWELILVDDCSPDPAVRGLLGRFAADDERVKVVEREENGHIVAASNDGVALARGEFIVLLDHDDLLVSEALSRVARAVEDYPDADYLYSDEDKVDNDGNHYDEFRKPIWSPERLRGQMYTGHLSVLRTEAVRRVGAFREGYDGSQDHDLVLRVTEVARRVVHIPEVLYHWRTIPGSAAADSNAKPYAAIAGRKAVQDHLDRLGISGTVDHGPANGLYRISRPLNPARRVSIVIPTIGSSGLVWGATRVFVVEAVKSVLDHTEHVNLEVVIVYDEPTPSHVLDTLREVVGERLVLVPFHEPFNYSRKMNLGVLHSTGDRLVLLNDDVAARSDKWLEELVAPLDEVDVGMTGAKLTFSNDTIQHIGHFYSGGHYLHIALSEPSSSLGEFGVLGISREVSGVTAACAGIRRDTFDQVGGLSEALPVNFNDVDLSYKVRRTDKRIVVVPHCELFHFESRTRERIVDDWERIAVQRRWGVPRIDAYVPRRNRSERVQQPERQRPTPRTTKTELPTATA